MSRIYLQTMSRGLVLGVLGLFIFQACGPMEISKKEAQAYIERWEEGYPKQIRSSSELDESSLKEQLETYPRVPKTDLRTAVVDAYREAEFDHQFVSDKGLTQKGKAALQVLEGVESEALNPKSFEKTKIEKQYETFQNVSNEIAKNIPLNLEFELKNKAVDWLTKKTAKSFSLNRRNFDEVSAFIERTNGEYFTGSIGQIRNLMERKLTLAKELEAGLAWIVAKYSYVQRHHRVRDIYIHPRHADRWNYSNIKGGRPDKAQAAFRAGEVWRTAGELTRKMKDVSAILQRRIEGVMKRGFGGDMTSALTGVRPQHPQYKRLVEAFGRYRKIVENGGWKRVEPVDGLARGDAHSTISKLKKRLRVEGFFPEKAKIDSRFDKELREAIIRYQKSHQIRVTGRPHGMFWTSLNIPAEYRLKQIKINIQRWRDTNIRYEDPYYAFVNIPEFVVEVWKGQSRTERMAVVVGNDESRERKDEDKKTKTKKQKEEEPPHPNRTPQLSAYIDRIIYNPFWNVTPRIRREEVLPKVRASVEKKYRSKIQKELKSQKSSSYLTSMMEGAGLDDGTDSEAGDNEDEKKKQKESKQKEPIPSELSPYLRQKKVESLLGTEKKISETMFDALPKNAQKRYTFDIEKLKKLFGPESQTNDKILKKMFPYLDQKKGIVDVTTTDPDHIPKWYEKNRYEVVNPGEPWEYVRMLQGKDNALGEVKIIFPNQKWVYLHDTPKKHLFSHAIRAYSHGCMRMERPLEMAKRLLETDGQYEDYDIDEILKGKKVEGKQRQKKRQVPIFLNKPVPIHVDYFTVRVDDEGIPHFFADVYDYDEKRIDEGKVQLWTD